MGKKYDHYQSDQTIPSSSCSRTPRSRTVTRGVNRGARVDLMGAMEKQVKRYNEPIEPILRTFFKEEKLSLD